MSIGWRSGIVLRAHLAGFLGSMGDRAWSGRRLGLLAFDEKGQVSSEIWVVGVELSYD